MYGALTMSGGEPPRGIRWPPSLQAGDTGRTLPPADPRALLGDKPCGSFVPGLPPWRLHRLCAVALLPLHPPLEQEGTVLGREDCSPYLADLPVGQTGEGQVHRHLDQHEVRYLQFAFRWMNNLLMREVPLRCTIRLWDTYQLYVLMVLATEIMTGPPRVAACSTALAATGGVSGSGPVGIGQQRAGSGPVGVGQQRAGAGPVGSGQQRAGQDPWASGSSRQVRTRGQQAAAGRRRSGGAVTRASPGENVRKWTWLEPPVLREVWLCREGAAVGNPGHFQADGLVGRTEEVGALGGGHLCPRPSFPGAPRLIQEGGLRWDLSRNENINSFLEWKCESQALRTVIPVLYILVTSFLPIPALAEVFPSLADTRGVSPGGARAPGQGRGRHSLVSTQR
ncbi:hypothetical protein J1605_020544 [Eschrichtius robustus]|uniref:Rab-GAP TBC domain-containing protein n=1 Tax=Eschrichtius robustus TaxID=9764 RepID=A0AB34HG44_ESCRO|nr:hypothetical protein J1605_020544 [Eschrichtius robustus]